MVDRVARDKFAQLLRHLAAGNLTNGAYEDAAHLILMDADRKDRALRAIYSRVWYFYDDTRVHLLRDKHALTDAGQHAVARWVLFLHCDFEYEWPIRSCISLSNCLLRLCTLGLAGVILNPLNERRMRRMGSWDLWPFIREVDCKRAASAAQRRPVAACGLLESCARPEFPAREASVFTWTTQADTIKTSWTSRSTRGT
jgi:hypothetical protein